MEDQIFDIIIRHMYHQNINDEQNCAKEIATHVMEFNKWIFSECPFLIGENANRGIIAWRLKTNEQLTLDQLYQYWLKEVKNV